MRLFPVATAGLLLLPLAGCDAGTSPDPIPASVTVDRATLAFGAVGSQVTLHATVRNAAGDSLPVAVAWSHARPAVIQLSDSGLVTALATGVDTIIARAGLAADTVPVTVTQVPAAVSITGTPPVLTYLGGTAQLRATVTDSGGGVMPAAPVTWSSAAPQILAVDSTGLVTAAGLGSARITATAGGQSAALTLVVDVTGPVGGPITGEVIPCSGGLAGPFPCSGMSLLAYLPIGAVGGSGGIDLNDLWGWTDPVTGVEWAIVLRRDGAAFVSLADPLSPAYVGYLPVPAGATTNVWHDVKVYADHAFIVADGAGPHGMQVFDLTRLRSVTGPPVTFTATARYTGVASVHNIAINTATGYAYLVGANSGGTTCGGGLHMVDIRQPANPTFAGCFADPLTGRARTGYTHDAQCVVYTGPDPDHAGQEICFGANETHLSIADVTDKAAPIAVSRVAYPNVAYTHQGWLSADQRYFFVNDELDERFGAAATTRTLIFDVIDLDDPVLAGQFFGPTPASDHNHYVVGTRLVASNYQYGVRVLDISDPLNPFQLGHFDTAPTETDIPGFGGSWSNYPFFASGLIVVSSGAEGLFVLRIP